MTSLDLSQPDDMHRRTHEPELAGRVAIVTGAANGMGVDICETLADEGAVLVMAGRDLDALEREAARINDGRTAGAITHRCDVTQENDTVDLARCAIEQYGRIDILVNTAGVIGPIETAAQDVSVGEFQHVLEVNVTATFLATKAVLPTMIAAKRGRIVNIAGTSGLRGYKNRVAYSASKWAVRGLTRTLALELGQYGVTVNDVCPNVTDGGRMTTIVHAKAQQVGKTPDEVYGEFAAQTALGRFIQARDIAEAVRFLVSDRARNITGHDLVVDAGWSA